MQFSNFAVIAMLSMSSIVAKPIPEGLSLSTSITTSNSSLPAPSGPSTDKSLTIIRTTKAAIPGSPISQAVISDGHIFVSGFLPLAPVTGAIVGEGDVVAQTLAILNNIKIVIEEAGSSLGKVAKVTLYLKNIDHYDTVNRVYADFFGTHRPARSAVAVAAIPLGVLVQIDATVRFVGSSQVYSTD